jgi:Family of unknown function (DUF5678)
MTGMTPTFHPADPVEGVEIAAFHRLLPSLRVEHGGEYVALREGRVIASGESLDAVCREAVRVAPARAVYCGWVEPVEDGVAFFGRFEVADEPVVVGH